MEQIIVKQATIQEAAILSVLGQVTFMETYEYLFENLNDLIEYCQESFTIDGLTESIKSKNDVYLIAYLNDLPVGYTKGILNAKSNLIKCNMMSQIERIYIKKEFVGKKIGLHLKEELIKKIKYSKSEAVWLLVNPTNQKAINFYKKNGFSEIGADIFSIGDQSFEAITMAKSLK